MTGSQSTTRADGASSSTDRGSSSRQGRTHTQCSICSRGVYSSISTMLLTCGHFYHRACLKDWLKESSQCAVCGQQVSESDKAAIKRRVSAYLNAFLRSRSNSLRRRLSRRRNENAIENSNTSNSDAHSIAEESSDDINALAVVSVSFDVSQGVMTGSSMPNLEHHSVSLNEPEDNRMVSYCTVDGDDRQEISTDQTVSRSEHQAGSSSDDVQVTVETSINREQSQHTTRKIRIAEFRRRLALHRNGKEAFQHQINCLLDVIEKLEAKRIELQHENNGGLSQQVILDETSDASPRCVEPEGEGSRQPPPRINVQICHCQMELNRRALDLLQKILEVILERNVHPGKFKMLFEGLEGVLIELIGVQENPFRAMTNLSLEEICVQRCGIFPRNQNCCRDAGVEFSIEEVNDEKYDPCLFCLDEFQRSDSVVLECGHVFHDKCIKRWIIESPNCPVCRHAVDVEFQAVLLLMHPGRIDWSSTISN